MESKEEDYTKYSDFYQQNKKIFVFKYTTLHHYFLNSLNLHLFKQNSIEQCNTAQQKLNLKELLSHPYVQFSSPLHPVKNYLG